MLPSTSSKRQGIVQVSNALPVHLPRTATVCGLARPLEACHAASCHMLGVASAALHLQISPSITLYM
jgi:hypothetical protein